MKLKDGGGRIRTTEIWVNASPPSAVNSHFINNHIHEGGREDATKGTLPQVHGTVPREVTEPLARHPAEIPGMAVGAGGDGEGPVSYTHLTLPTILLV